MSCLLWISTVSFGLLVKMTFLQPCSGTKFEPHEEKRRKKQKEEEDRERRRREEEEERVRREERRRKREEEERLREEEELSRINYVVCMPVGISNSQQVSFRVQK